MTDGFFLSGGADGTMRLWELNTGVCLRIFEGYCKAIISIALTSDEKFAVTGSKDGILRLWAIASGECRMVYKSHPSYCFSNGLINSNNEEFSYHDLNYDLEYGKTFNWDKRIFYGHMGAVNSVAVTGNGRYIISGSDDHTMRLWDLNSGECRWIFGGHNGGHRFWVEKVAVSPCGCKVLSFSDEIRVWKLTSKRWRLCFWGFFGERPLRTYKLKTEYNRILALTPDGNYVLVSSKNNLFRVHKLRSGNCLWTFKEEDGINAAAITQDGKTAILGGLDGTLKVWSLK